MVKKTIVTKFAWESIDKKLSWYWVWMSCLWI